MSKDIKVTGALVFPEGVPTRAGEAVNSVGEIYDIPAPRVGMIIYDKSTGLNYIVRSLKEKVIDGVMVDNAQVDEYEELLEKQVTWINEGNSASNMNDFVEAGIYELKGERTRSDDNLPFGNTGGGHTFHARLEVLDSSIAPEGQSDDICITQKLTLSNRVAGDGDVYIRTGRGASKEAITWESWGKVQQNIEVGVVATLDNLIDNGIYSGVYDGPGSKETFVLVVINDYALATQLGVDRRVSQFKYSVYTGSNVVTYHSRVWDGRAWSAWSIINADEIASMINAEVAKLTNVDAELIARIQALASWVEEHGVEAAQLAAGIQSNATAIAAETERAQREEKSNADAIAANADAITEIKSKALRAKTLELKGDGQKLELTGSAIDGTTSVVLSIPAATTEKAGVMTAADKKKLDSIEIINDLTTGGADKALSAEMGIALKGKLTEISKIDLIEYSVVKKDIAIKSDGEIISNPNYKCYKIRNENFSLITGQANTYKGFLKVAFYNGEPSQSTFISGSVQSAGGYSLEQYTLNVPTDCEYILVCESVTVYVGDSSCFIYADLNQIFKTEKEDVASIQSELNSLNKRVVNTENDVDFILEKIEPTVKTVAEDFTIDGYYQNSGTEVTSGYNYISAPLINVNEGDIVYLHNWKEYTDSSVGVIWCYDNDNKPYNNSNARILARMLTKVSNGEYQFVIPSNCSQIGISIAPEYPEDAYAVIGDDTYRLTESFRELLGSPIVSDENMGDKTANYYLKGNSNIAYPSSKKMGIITAGQSNIDGRNSYSDLPSDFVNPNSKVRFCNNVNGAFSDFQIKDGGSNNDWSFDAIVYDLLTNPSYGNQSEIYVMKKSMGGTSIDKDGATDYHWTADYEYLASENYSLLRSFEKTIRKAVEQQGDNFEIKAFVWHQGEGDTVSLEVANKYYDNLKNMLAYVRGIVGNPRLHFFCGSISEKNVVSTYKDIINEAYFKLAKEDAYFHLVDMSDASLEDSWHFNFEWSIYFGKMVYDLMIDCGIVEGVKVNPEKPS